MIREGVIDLLFANESELHALYQTADFETAMSALRDEKNLLGIVTRSDKGCVVASARDFIAVPAYPVDEVVDTTGAGDLFAAGFLAGYTQNLPHERSAALGALAAAEIISHVGARPQKDLLQLARDNNILT